MDLKMNSTFKFTILNLLLPLLVGILIVFIAKNILETKRIKDIGKDYASEIRKETGFKYEFNQINDLCFKKIEKTEIEKKFSENINYVISVAVNSCIKELQKKVK